jgi:hypothetical protein
MFESKFQCATPDLSELSLARETHVKYLKALITIVT